MNRPKYIRFKNRKNKGIDSFINYLLIYKRDLEAYCDELEKALDKASKLIDNIYGSCPLDVKDFCPHNGECNDDYIECWKEYLLKDE